MRIYASVSRDPTHPWMVRKVEISHNHVLSANDNTYASFKKLEPSDFELVCSLLRKGETSSVVLKVSFSFFSFLFFG